MPNDNSTELDFDFEELEKEAKQPAPEVKPQPQKRNPAPQRKPSSTPILQVTQVQLEELINNAVEKRMSVSQPAPQSNLDSKLVEALVKLASDKGEKSTTEVGLHANKGEREMFETSNIATKINRIMQEDRAEKANSFQLDVMKGKLGRQVPMQAPRRDTENGIKKLLFPLTLCVTWNGAVVPYTWMYEDQTVMVWEKHVDFIKEHFRQYNSTRPLAKKPKKVQAWGGEQATASSYNVSQFAANATDYNQSGVFKDVPDSEVDSATRMFLQ